MPAAEKQVDLDVVSPKQKLETQEADALRGIMECCDRCDASHNKKSVLFSLSCTPNWGREPKERGQGKGDQDLDPLGNLYCQLSGFVIRCWIVEHAEPEIRPRVTNTKSTRFQPETPQPL